jgi:hypothetical protein
MIFKRHQTRKMVAFSSTSHACPIIDTRGCLQMESNATMFTIKLMYLDITKGHTSFLHKYIWKIGVPLKIGIFMWFPHKHVILTNNNLEKYNWNWCKKCCFCDQDETIQHLYFTCPFGKILWCIVHMAFNIYPPTNIINLFGNRLCGIHNK